MDRVQLPDNPIYVPEDSDTVMHAPEWSSFPSIVDWSPNPVAVCNFDQLLLKEVMAEHRRMTLSDLRKRSHEHTSTTLIGCESYKATSKKPRQKCILQCGNHIKSSFTITPISRHTITCLQHPQALFHLHLHLLKPCLKVPRPLLAEIRVLQDIPALQQIQEIQVL